MIKNQYKTITGEIIYFENLNNDERLFINKMYKMYMNNTNFFTFENSYLNPGSFIYEYAKCTEKPICNTIIYRICSDLGNRLGIQQGFIKEII